MTATPFLGIWEYELNDPRLCARGTEQLYCIFVRQQNGNSVVKHIIAENLSREDAQHIVNCVNVLAAVPQNWREKLYQFGGLAALDLQERVMSTLRGCRQMLHEAAKQFRQLADNGHAAMCDRHRDNADLLLKDLAKAPNRANVSASPIDCTERRAAAGAR